MSLSRRMTAIAMAAMLLVVAACNSTGGGSSASAAALTPVKFQLQWVAQSQFAGYFAAIDQNYYKDVGLDVTLLFGVEPYSRVADAVSNTHLTLPTKA